MVTGCDGSTKGAGVVQQESAPAATHSVVYKLTGSAEGADVTYTAADGAAEQQADVALPMSANGQPGLALTVDSGAFLYFSAQNKGETGALTCSIEVDGVEITRHTSRGAFTIVTCQGRA